MRMVTIEHSKYFRNQRFEDELLFSPLQDTKVKKFQHSHRYVTIRWEVWRQCDSPKRKKIITSKIVAEILRETIKKNSLKISEVEEILKEL